MRWFKYDVLQGKTGAAQVIAMKCGDCWERNGGGVKKCSVTSNKLLIEDRSKHTQNCKMQYLPGNFGYFSGATFIWNTLWYTSLAALFYLNLRCIHHLFQ